MNNYNRFIDKNLYDAMNNRTFKLVVPASYTSSISQYYIDNNMEPISSNEWGTSITYMPVRKIIDLVFDGIEFSFKNPDDIVDVVDMLNRYLYVKDTAFNAVPDFDKNKIGVTAKLFIDKCEFAYKKLMKYVPADKRPKKFVRSIVDIMTS